MARHCHVDVETFSYAQPLNKLGTYRYAEDPSTEILCLMYAFGDEPVNAWIPIDIPKDLKARIRKTVGLLSGMEIGYEDRREMRINVLLDEKRVDLHQLLYRISLLVDHSLASLDDPDRDELPGVDPRLVRAVGRRGDESFVFLDLDALLAPILST